MMHLPSHPTPSSPASAPSVLVASASTWHRRLRHPGVDVLSKLSHDSSVVCSRRIHDLYHACQLGHHIHLPVLVYLATNTTWLFLMITPILGGFFLCVLSLTLFPLYQKMSLISPHSLAIASKPSSATMVVSSITPPLAHSSPPKGYFCGCLLPTLLCITVKPSAYFAPSIICYVPCFLGFYSGSLLGRRAPHCHISAKPPPVHTYPPWSHPPPMSTCSCFVVPAILISRQSRSQTGTPVHQMYFPWILH
jgi:hypothetical protein